MLLHAPQTCYEPAPSRSRGDTRPPHMLDLLLKQRPSMLIAPSWRLTARHTLPPGAGTAGSGWRSAPWRSGRAAERPTRGRGTETRLGQSCRALKASLKAGSQSLCTPKLRLLSRPTPGGLTSRGCSETTSCAAGWTTACAGSSRRHCSLRREPSTASRSHRVLASIDVQVHSISSCYN